MKAGCHWFIACLLFVVSGCGDRGETEKPSPPPKTAEEKPPPKKVSDRPANLSGSVLIVEYHKVAPEEARWDRSIAKFKQDLERLYALGYRPVSLSSYLDGQMELPPGASPVIFTFDDSHPSQFRLLEDGSLDPSCALGIWDAFAEDHPDFPIKATFFVLPDSGPWGQRNLVDKKLAMLKEWGCELGSHSLAHKRFDRMTSAEVERELKGANDWIRAKGFEPEVIALPFGISPKDPELLKKYHRAALLVGANPAPAPTDPKRNLMRLPRVQSVEGDFGLTYWLDLVKSGKSKPYVAD